MMRELRTFRLVVVAGFLTACSAVAQAKTEVELGLGILNYRDTSSKMDLDDLDIEADSTTTLTGDPNWTLTLLPDQYILELGVESGREDEIGRTLVAGAVVGEHFYAGAFLGMETIKSTIENDPDTGASTKTKANDNFLLIGPFAMYRTKTLEKRVTAHAALLRVSSKTKTEAGAAEAKSNWELLGLRFGGSYHAKVADRLYAGAGASYTLSLSGDAEVDGGNNEQDGDFDFQSFELELINLQLEL